MSLTAKQEAFAQAYVLHRNATRAALEAGYAVRTAYSMAHENLKKPEVAARISDLQDDEQRLMQLRTDHLLLNLQAQAFANILDYVSWDRQGRITIKESAALSRDQGAGIISIKQGANGIELKLVDTLRAKEMLMRHLGLFSADEDNRGPESVNVYNDNRAIVLAAERIGQVYSLEELRELAEEARRARGLIREPMVGRLEE